MFVNINCITYVRISIQILFPAYIFLFLTTESHESVSRRIFNPFSSILLFRYLNPPVSKRKKWLARNDSSEELESVINVAFHYFNAFDWYLHIYNSFYCRSRLFRNGGKLSVHNVRTNFFGANLKYRKQF